MAALLDLFRPGQHIYLPGGSGEILALAQALAANPQRMRDVRVTSCLLPGFNFFDYAALDASACLTTFLLPPALRSSFEGGRTQVVPLSYSRIARYLEEESFDVAIFHVAAPDARGMCSLGISADFAPHVWRTASRRALVINHAMPAIRRAPHVQRSEADMVYEIESPLVIGGEEKFDVVLMSIAASAAKLVPNGAAFQLGIGGAPGAMWRQLTGHCDLTLASGMVTPGWRLLRDAGALRATGHRAGIALGDVNFYHELAEQDLLEMAPVAITHDVGSIMKLTSFTAVNSALEIDLFGQANLEWRDGRLVSGVGGALDFARGAMASLGGRAISAMPATAANGTKSRIVVRLETPNVSLSRDDVDTVVTEFGVAELRGRSVAERANALIAVASPEYRDSLRRGWLHLAADF